jgi:hypothetical protein
MEMNTTGPEQRPPRAPRRLDLRIARKRVASFAAGTLLFVLGGVVGSVVGPAVGQREAAVTTAPISQPPAPSPASLTAPPSAVPTQAPSVGTVGIAGDIACSAADNATATARRCHQMATSDLLRSVGIVITTGDNQYERGELSEFEKSYAASWGRFLDKTYPSVGNHDYLTPEASGYFSYFGARAGDPAEGWYAFDYAGWHFIALNSNCTPAGGCGPSSPQVRWLKGDLAKSTARCTVAFWHKPRWASGQYADDDRYAAFWQTLYEGNAEIVLNGHDHNYQRYAPLDPRGVRDDARGLRQYIVGTGGRSHYPVLDGPIPNREAADDTTFGILELTLHDGAYDWRFVPEAGDTYHDRGSGVCH